MSEPTTEQQIDNQSIILHLTTEQFEAWLRGDEDSNAAGRAKTAR